MQGTGITVIVLEKSVPTGIALFQVSNRLGQHASQNRRRGSNLLKLEQMDQVAQLPVIAT